MLTEYSIKKLDFTSSRIINLSSYIYLQILENIMSSYLSTLMLRITFILIISIKSAVIMYNKVYITNI